MKPFIHVLRDFIDLGLACFYNSYRNLVMTQYHEVGRCPDADNFGEWFWWFLGGIQTCELGALLLDILRIHISCEMSRNRSKFESNSSNSIRIWTFNDDKRRKLNIRLFKCILVTVLNQNQSGQKWLFVFEDEKYAAPV